MGFKLLLMLLLTCVVNYSGGQFGTFRNSFGSSSRGSFGTFGRSSSNNQEPVDTDTDAASPAISTSPASPARSALFSTQGRSRFSTLATSSFSSPSSTADESSNDSTSDSSEDSSTSEPSTTPPSPTPTSPESPSYTPLARPSYTPPARPSHTPPARPSYTPPARPSYTPPTRTSSTTPSSSPSLDTADADSDSPSSTVEEDSAQVSHELKGQSSSSSFFGKSRLNRPSFQRPSAPSSTQSSTPSFTQSSTPSLTPSSSRSSSRVRPLPTSSRSRLPLTPPSSRSRLPLTPSSSRSSPTPSTSSSAPSSSSGFQPKKSGGFKASFGYRRPSFARTTTESPTTTTTSSTTTTTSTSSTTTVTTSTTTTTISTTTIVSTSTTTATPKPSSQSEDNSDDSTENDSVKSIPSFLKKKGSGYRFLQKLRDMADASEESDQNQSVADNKPNLVRISSTKKEEKEETRLQSKPSSNFKLLRLTKSKDAKSQAKKRVVNLLKVSETKPTVKIDSNQKDDAEPTKITSNKKTEVIKADIDEKRIDLKELKKKMSVLKKLRLPSRVVKFNPPKSQSSEDRSKSKNTFSRTTKSPVNNPTRTTKSSVRTTTKSSVRTTTKSSTRPSRPPFRISPIRISTPTIKPEEAPQQKRVVSIFSKDTPPVFNSAKSSTEESSSEIRISGSTEKVIETASTFSDNVKADPIRKPGPIFFDRKALKERLRAVVLDAINEDDTSSSIQEKVEKLRDKIVAELPDEAKHHIEKTDTFEEGAARLFTFETDSNIPVSKSESIKPRVRVTTKSTILSSRSPPTYKPVAAKSPKVIATKTPKIIATTTSPTRVLPTYKPSKISKGNVQNTEDAQDIKTRRIVSLFSGDRTRFGVAVKAKVKDDTETVKDDDQLEVVEDISAPVISEGRRKKLVSIQVKIPDMNDDMEAMIEEAFTIRNEADEQPIEKPMKVKHRFNGILKKIRVHASLMDKEAVGTEALTEKVVAKESAAEETLSKDSAPQKPKVIKAEQIVVVPLNSITETAPKVSKKYFNVGPSYVPSYVPAGSRVVGSAVPSDLTGVDTLDVKTSGSRSSIPGGSQPIQLKQDVQVEEYEETVVPGSFSSSSRNILKPVLADTARISPETFRNIDDTLVPGSFSSNSDSRYLSPSFDSRDHLEVDIVPGSFSTDARNTEVQGLDFNNPNQQQSSEGNIQDNSLYQVDTLEDEVRYHVNDLGGSVKIPLDDNPRYQENTRYQVEDNTKYKVQDQTRYQVQDDTRYQVQDDTRYQDNLRSLINENLRNQDITGYQVEDNTRYQVDDTPRYQDTTRYQVDDTPRYQVDDSPRYQVHDTPRYQVDDNPRYQGDTRYQEEDNTRYQVEDNTRYQVDDAPRYQDNARYQVEDAPRYQDNTRYQVDDAPRYQVEDNTRYQVDENPRYQDNTRYQVEDNTRYQVDENPRYQDNTRYQVEDNTRYQVDDNPRYQDNTRYQVEDNSRYQVEDNTRYQVEDNTRYQVEDNTRYQVDDAPRYQVEDNTRYQVDDAPRYQDNTRYQVKDSSRVQVDDNPRYQDNTRYQVDDSSQFSPSQFSSSRNSQFSQSPVEYANFDYDEQGNILLLDRSGFPIATVPPGSVLDSSSSFPSDLRSSDVEITPVFISNNRDASRSGKSLGSDYENQLARHQLQIHRILEQQRSFNLG